MQEAKYFNKKKVLPVSSLSANKEVLLQALKLVSKAFIIKITHFSLLHKFKHGVIEGHKWKQRLMYMDIDQNLSPNVHK